MSDQPVTSIGIAQVKRQFADVLGAVHHRGERFVIERRGTPLAALVPLDDLARLEGTKSQGVLALVGAFDDAAELPEVLDNIVQTRQTQRRREAPKLPE